QQSGNAHEQRKQHNDEELRAQRAGKQRGRLNRRSKSTHNGVLLYSWNNIYFALQSSKAKLASIRNGIWDFPKRWPAQAFAPPVPASSGTPGTASARTPSRAPSSVRAPRPAHPPPSSAEPSSLPPAPADVARDCHRSIHKAASARQSSVPPGASSARSAHSAARVRGSRGPAPHTQTEPPN